MAIVLGASGCRRGSPAAPAPPPTVSVSPPVQREVTSWDEYPGRLAPIDMVNVQARVGGFIEQAQFSEGAIVQKGQILFTLDTRPYQAALDQARASLAQAEAQQRFASSEYQRMLPLRQTGAVAENQFLSARQALETANAAVMNAQAAIEVASLNLEWCYVTAPVTGRVGQKLVTAGNLITGGTAQATLLTTIVTLDPIYCYADVDERSVLEYQRLVREGLRPSTRSNQLPAQLAVGTEAKFAYQGHIDFVNNQISATTGTITIRGVFSNPTGQLLPGFYARLRILHRGRHLALLVPIDAIGSQLAQQYVLTVPPDGVVQYRPVTVGTRFGELQEVEGIGPTDRVIVNGLVNIRAGATVQAKEVPIQAAIQAEVNPTTAATAPAGVGQGPSRSSSGPALQGAGVPGIGGTSGGSMGGGGAPRGTGSRGGGP